MKTKEFIRLAEQNGWVWDKRRGGKGSHRKYRKGDRVVVIPCHVKELGRYLEMKLREEMGL